MSYIGPYYSPGPLTSALLRANNAQSFIDDVVSGLEHSNWTIARSFSGGSSTTGYFVTSDKPVLGQRMKTKIWCPGGSTVNMQAMDFNEIFQATASPVAMEAQKTMRLIAGPYQQFVFFDQSVSVGITQFAPPFQSLMSHNDFCCGIPVLHSDASCFWSLGQNNSWRHHTAPFASSDVQDFGFLLNGALHTNGDSDAVPPQLLTLRSTQLQNPISFSNGIDYPVINPMMCIGTSLGVTVLPIWDAFVLSAPETTKLITTADFHTFEAFTLTVDLSVDVASLWLAIGSSSASRIGSYSY